MEYNIIMHTSVDAVTQLQYDHMCCMYVMVDMELWVILYAILTLYKMNLIFEQFQ